MGKDVFLLTFTYFSVVFITLYNCICIYCIYRGIDSECILWETYMYSTKQVCTCLKFLDSCLLFKHNHALNFQRFLRFFYVRMECEYMYAESYTYGLKAM